MCQILSISESSYYRWLKSHASPRQQSNAVLGRCIHALYHEHKGMAGSPMITADLRNEPDFASVGKNRVARIMRMNNLRCKARRKFITTTDSRLI